MLKISNPELFWVVCIIFIMLLISEFYTHIYQDSAEKRSIVKTSFFNGIRGGLIGLIISPDLAFTNFVTFMVTTPTMSIFEAWV